MDDFDNSRTFAAYLIDRGWIKEGHERDIESASAAFESIQRRRGSEAARKAMNKAAEKAW